MSCWFLGSGVALILASCAVAFAQDGGAAVRGAASSSMPSADFLLSIGPHGALVWGCLPAREGGEAHRADRALGAGPGADRVACSSMMLLLSLTLVGCTPGTERVAQAYVLAEAELRPAEAYAALCASDRAVYPLAQFTERHYLAPKSPVAWAIAERVELKSVVVAESPAGTRAAVTFNAPTYPDHVGVDEDADVAAAIRAGKYVNKESLRTIDLREEEGKWCVFENFAKAEVLRGLIGDGLRREQQGDTRQAIAAFELAYAMSPENSHIAMALGRLRQREQDVAEADAYRSMLAVSTPTVAEVGGRFYVSGEVQNLGERTISKVRLMIYGLDGEGNPVFEAEAVAPVDPAAAAQQPERRLPLKPHYSRRYWGWIPEVVTTKWAGQVRVEVAEAWLAQ